MSLVSGTVLVTGATGGLGRAIARAFAGEGAELILTGRRETELAALAAELDGRPITCDLAATADLEDLLEASREADVLIANAGLPGSGELTELSQRQIDTILAVNMRAPIALARGLLPGMLARGRGHLVFVSSLAGKATSPLSSLYSATKFGLRGFSLALREDLRGTGVSSSVVLPGFISDAGLFADAGVRLPPGIGTRKPADVAAAVIHAIEQDRAEAIVAPPLLRFGADLAAVAPELAARLARLGDSRRVAREHAEGQIDKRPRS